MKKILLAGAVVGAALMIARTLDQSAKTSELWSAATADLPGQV
ncbi:DLW-39 family protein [Kytococcus sedentarius]